jgi:hypothetical protein
LFGWGQRVSALPSLLANAPLHRFTHSPTIIWNDDMELRRRMVFRGSAAAFGGRIVRPKDVVFEMPGASALPVTGGRSVARIPRAEGLFDDRDGAVALSNHKVREDSLRTTTRVQAEVRRLTVGREQRLKIARLAAELQAHSPGVSGQPPIAPGDIVVDGVTIDGFRLRVELGVDIFQRYDTHAKLLTALDDPKFVRSRGSQLFLTTHFEGYPPPPPGGWRVPPCETMYATLVRKIEWEGKPAPGTQIDHHSVTVDDFGKIFFGEMLIAPYSRRLTLLRLELGSDSGGSGGGPDVDTNGSWWP